MLTFYFARCRGLSLSVCVFLFLGIFTQTAVTAQVTRYVSTTGTNGTPATATSWATSTTNLQGAIDASSAGDQVWVAVGVYKPGGNTNTNRDLGFRMKNGVAIYGGFQGTEQLLTERPAIRYSTPSSATLSGEIGDQSSINDNSYQVVKNPNTLTNSAVLDGFVITRGNANGTDGNYYYQQQVGGGMHNYGSNGFCNPTVRNCLFISNRAKDGGAIFNYGASTNSDASPVMINCWFVGNVAAQYGGAVYTYGPSSPASNNVGKFINCLFLNNSSSINYGGGIFNSVGNAGNASPTILNCTFTGNGIAIYNSGVATPKVINSIIWPDNITNGNGAVTTFTYSIVPGGTGTNSNADPRFVNTGAGNVRLQTSSPAINAGNSLSYTAANGPNKDLDGNDRIVGRSIDMGAFEYNTPCAVSLVASATAVCVSSTASLTALPTGGMPPFSFSYTTSAGIQTGAPTSASTLSITLATTGQQSVTVTMTDDLGCVSTTTVAFTVSTGDPQFTASLLAGSGNRCPGSVVSLTALPSGGQTPYRYSYAASPGLTLANPATTPVLSATLASLGVQTVTVTITDNRQCISQGNLSLTVANNNPLFVRAAGTGSGLSWADASGNLQTMINQACPNGEVWVAAGLYKPTATTARDISFSMRNQVAIYGGFLGTESSLTERPPITISQPSSSTLSGEIGSSSLVDNSYHVIFNPNSLNLTTSAVLDGFVITAGAANGNTDERRSGGGIYNGGEDIRCNPTIQNCYFYRNQANYYGGAIYNEGYEGESSPVITACAFVSNSAVNPSSTAAQYGGGGLYNNGAGGRSRPLITNCLFTQNTATNGGAIYNDGSLGLSSMTLVNATIQGNTARTGGAVNSVGTFGSSTHWIVNSIVWGNTATNTGPGLRTTSATHNVSYSDIQAGASGTGNLNTDPLFINAAQGNLSLQPTSPVIDKGNSVSYTAFSSRSTDGAGNPRIVGDQIDMGVFESSVTSPTVSVGASASVVCENGLVSLSAVVAGGVAPFSYTWVGSGGIAIAPTNASVVSATLTSVGQQTVTVITTDARTIRTTATMSLTASAFPTIESVAVSGSITCATPSVTLTVTATGPQNLSYAFSTGVQQTGSPNVGIVTQADVYTITVTNPPGSCLSSTTVSVGSDTGVPAASLTPMSGTLTCLVRSITLTASSADNVTYQFSGGTPTANSNEMVVSTAGTYSVVATGTNGCSVVASTDIVADQQPPVVPVLTVSNNGVLTCNNPVLTLTATADPTVTFSYIGTGLAAQPTTANNATVSAVGTYTVVVTSANGCTASATTTVTGLSTPVGPVNLVTQGAFGCVSGSVSITAISSGATSYSLLGPGGQQVAPNGIFTITQIGTYSVLAGNGTTDCQRSTSRSFIQSPPASAAAIQVSGSVSCGNPARLTATVNGTSAVLTGPKGYVYSHVVRLAGTYPITATGITEPGQYTLTVNSGPDCPPAVYSVSVIGTACR